MQQSISSKAVDGDGSNETAPDLVRKCDVRPHDVLMGRGHFSHPGNDRFLLIVSERQADYRAAKFTEKQQIATEVLQLVLDPTYLSGGDGGGGGREEDETTGGDDDGPNGVLPPVPMPARFLQLESGKRKSDYCTFRIVSGKAVDEKVKMALRQKAFQNNKKGGDKSDVLMSSLGRHAEEGGSMTFAHQGVNNVASKESTASACLCAAVGRPGLSSSLGSTASGRSVLVQQLLPFLRAAQETLRPLREKYHGASTSNELCSDLNSFGTILYRMLANDYADGPNSSSNVSSNRDATDNSNERLAKREHRRGGMEGGGQGEDGSLLVLLQDLGYPTSISIFVQSLIDATDEDAAERFQSICDVDNDLRLMIEYPDQYLLDPPHETSTGKLIASSKLYGAQSQQNKLANAFQSVIVTGEERRGLVLISGQSGTGKVSQGLQLLVFGSMRIVPLLIFLAFFVGKNAFPLLSRRLL